MIHSRPDDGNYSTDSQPTLSVVVLCYRSGHDVVPVVMKLVTLLNMLADSWEIVLVGNYLSGTDDPTPAVVRELASRHPSIRAIVQEKKGMMGWDMRSGLEAARGDYIAVIDGDGQFPLEAIITCYARLKHGDCDMVQTYRVRRDDGLFRRVLSLSYNIIARLLFPDFKLVDINSKPKVLTRAFYRRLRLKDDGWFIDAEIVLKANLLGGRIGFEPIHFYRLEGRSSFIRPSAIFEFVRSMYTFRVNLKNIAVDLGIGDV